MLDLTLELVVAQIILVLALTIDSFTASFAYGIAKIRLPWISVLIITGISSLVLALSASIGVLISGIIPSHWIKITCFMLLMIPAIIKLFDSFIKVLIRRYQNQVGHFSFNIQKLHLILKVYADPDTADFDSSKILSARESVAVALALSLDGLAVGMGAAMESFHFGIAIPASIILGVIAVKLGCLLGAKTSSHVKRDLSWISGVLLIGLAIMKLI